MALHKDHVWLNMYEGGQANYNVEGLKPLSTPAGDAFHRYCLDWDLGTRQVKWTLDGAPFFEQPMSSLWSGMPMRIVFSYW